MSWNDNFFGIVKALKVRNISEFLKGKKNDVPFSRKNLLDSEFPLYSSYCMNAIFLLISEVVLLMNSNQHLYSINNK